VPVSGVENAAYYFSTYNAPDIVPVSGRKKIMVLGVVRTESARASSSTIAACMRPWLSVRLVSSRSCQLQSGNGLHGLRYVR